jgi:YVTN family beta-propeller protein
MKRFNAYKEESMNCVKIRKSCIPIIPLFLLLFSLAFAGPHEPVDDLGELPYQNFLVEKGQTIDDFICRNRFSRYTRTDIDPGIDPEGDFMGWAAFTTDGNKVLLTNKMTDNVTVFDWSTMTVDTNLAVGDYPGGIAVTDTFAIVACGFGDEVHVINLNTYAIDAIFPLPAGQQPWIVEVSPDFSKAYVACDISNTCEVFDLTTLTHTLTISNFPFSLLTWGFNSENGRSSFSFTSFVVTTDGNYLIVCNRADTMFFFNTTTGLAEDTIAGVTDGANVALSGDGTQVVAINLSNPLNVQRVDIASRTITGSVDFTGHTYGWATTVAVNVDGSKAFVSLSNNMSGIGRFATSDFIELTNTYSAFWIGVSPDHSLAISGQYRFSIIDFASETIVGQHIGNSQDRGAVSPIGMRAVGFDYARHEGLYFYNYYASSPPSYRGTTNTGRDPEGDAPRRVAITPDGSTAVVANVLSDNITIIDLNTLTVDTIIPNCGDRVQNVAVTSDGNWAVGCGMNSNSLKVIDLSTNSIVADVYTGTRPGVVSIGPGDTLAYVGNISSNTVSVVRLQGAASYKITDISCGVIGVVWACYGVLSDVAASPDGGHCLVAASFDDQVRVISTATNTVVATLTVGDFPLQIAYNDSGDYAIVTNYFSDNFSVIHVNGASSSVVGTYGYGDDGPLRLAYNAALDEIGIGHYYNKAVVNVVPETGAFISRDSYSAYGSLIQVAFDDTGAPLVLTMSDGTNPGHIHGGTDVIPLPASPSFFDFNDGVDKAVITMPGPDYATVIDWSPTGIEEIEVVLEQCTEGIKVRFSLHGGNHEVIQWLIERGNGESDPEMIATLSGERDSYLDCEVEEGQEYRYWVTALYENGTKKQVGPFIATFTNSIPQGITVRKIFPQPIQNEWSVEISISEETNATVSLFDVSGSHWRDLWNGRLKRGKNRLTLDSKTIPTGIYFMRISIDHASLVRKIVIVK